MRALYFSHTLRKIESACRQLPLMQRAGEAAAALALKIMHPNHNRVLILAGPGNNGGDALEAAIHLMPDGYELDVLYNGDAARLPSDAQAAHQRFQEAGGRLQTTWPAPQRYGLIIDGLFGIGLNAAPQEQYAEWITAANSAAHLQNIPLLSLDCPSGLHGDSGLAHGDCINATHTISFLAAKPGLYTLDGPDHCGIISVDDLSIDCFAHAAPDGCLISGQSLQDTLPKRAKNTHKGDYGVVAVLGGDRGMLGASVLAARAALHSGAGSVYVAPLAADAPFFDPFQPELMWQDPKALWELSKLDVLVCGPGLGQSRQAAALLKRALQQDTSLVLDADALNLLAFRAELQVLPATRQSPLLMTPHPKEAARLLNCELNTVQYNRVSSACLLAKRFNAHVALKGCGTVVATPDGSWQINPHGNPAMASAGMGDVLAGIAGALLAQGMNPVDALSLAVYTHSVAADSLAARNKVHALTANELIHGIRHDLCGNVSFN